MPRRARHVPGRVHSMEYALLFLRKTTASYTLLPTSTTLLLHTMARSNELTPALRERICELHAIGWGYRRIHQRYPWIPLSTIRYTIKKEHERREGVSKPRSGRPKKLTHELTAEPKSDVR
jgi:hypothetical protein